MLTYKKFINRIEQEYTPMMYEIYSLPEIHEDKRSYCWTGSMLYYEIFKLIDSNIKNNSIIMDLGAYPGTFLRLLRNVLYPNTKIELYGYGLVCEEDEINKYRKKADDNPLTKVQITDKPFDKVLLKEDIKFISGNLDYCNSFKIENFDSVELNRLKGKCDIITCMEVIEHLHTPYHLFDLCYDLLKKGGVCIMETNNVRGLYGIYQLLRGKSNLDFDLAKKYSLHKPTIKHPHIRFYSLEELVYMFQRAKFSIIKKYDLNWYKPLPYLINSGVLKKIKQIILDLLPGFKSHIFIKAIKL